MSEFKNSIESGKFSKNDNIHPWQVGGKTESNWLDTLTSGQKRIYQTFQDKSNIWHNQGATELNHTLELINNFRKRGEEVFADFLESRLQKPVYAKKSDAKGFKNLEGKVILRSRILKKDSDTVKKIWNDIPDKHIKNVNELIITHSTSKNRTVKEGEWDSLKRSIFLTASYKGSTPDIVRTTLYHEVAHSIWDSLNDVQLGLWMSHATSLQSASSYANGYYDKWQVAEENYSFYEKIYNNAKDEDKHWAKATFEDIKYKINGLKKLYFQELHAEAFAAIYNKHNTFGDWVKVDHEVMDKAVAVYKEVFGDV